MKILKSTVYLFLVFILITNGCLCGDDEDDDGLYVLTCPEIDKVDKTFTFEIFAKYAHNNEPIQGEGSVTLDIVFFDFVYNSPAPGQNCKFDMEKTKPSFTTNFDNNGKAVITTPTYEFDNKHDHMILSFTVHFPFSSSQDLFMNTQHGSARYNTNESSVLIFKYRSIEDL